MMRVIEAPEIISFYVIYVVTDRRGYMSIDVPVMGEANSMEQVFISSINISQSYSTIVVT